MATMRLLLIAAACGLVAALASACGVTDDASQRPEPLPAVVVGAGAAPESQIVARLYAGALARLGAPVSGRYDIGDRRAYLAALDDGRVTLVPELSGGLLAALQPRSDASEPEDVFKALSRALPQGLSVSDYSETAQWPADPSTRAQNVLPLYRTGTLSAAEIKKLNYVAGELTSADLAALVHDLTSGHNPDTLTQHWLDEHNF